MGELETITIRIERTLNQFIDTLVINNDNLNNRGLSLCTTKRGYVFYVYENNNKIYINPSRGKKYFPQSKKRLLDVLNDELIMNDRDLQYVQPIIEHIKRTQINVKNV